MSVIQKDGKDSSPTNDSQAVSLCTEPSDAQIEKYPFFVTQTRDRSVSVFLPKSTAPLASAKPRAGRKKAKTTDSVSLSRKYSTFRTMYGCYPNIQVRRKDNEAPACARAPVKRQTGNNRPIPPRPKPPDSIRPPNLSKALSRLYPEQPLLSNTSSLRFSSSRSLFAPQASTNKLSGSSGLPFSGRAKSHTVYTSRSGSALVLSRPDPSSAEANPCGLNQNSLSRSKMAITVEPKSHKLFESDAATTTCVKDTSPQRPSPLATQSSDEWVPSKRPEHLVKRRSHEWVQQNHSLQLTSGSNAHEDLSHSQQQSKEAKRSRVSFRTLVSKGKEAVRTSISR